MPPPAGASNGGGTISGPGGTLIQTQLPNPDFENGDDSWTTNNWVLQRSGESGSDGSMGIEGTASTQLVNGARVPVVEGQSSTATISVQQGASSKYEAGAQVAAKFAESAYGLPRPSAFIDLVLLFEGELTNERLRRRYEVSNVQASRLLAAYTEAYPTNLVRDLGAGRGRYLIGPGFKAQVSDGTIRAYLGASSDSPRITVVHTAADLSIISPDVLRQTQRAISLSHGLSIRYRSMGQPSGVRRRIWPHAIVFAGHRWHVRAYDDDRKAFLDLNLGRIDQVAPMQETAPAPAQNDTAWQTRVPPRLVPHPALSLPQRQLIRDEYFQGAASRTVESTGALVPYLLRDLEVAVDLDAEAPPAFQVALANAKDVIPWLFGSKERVAGD